MFSGPSTIIEREILQLAVRHGIHRILLLLLLLLYGPRRPRTMHKSYIDYNKYLRTQLGSLY